MDALKELDKIRRSWSAFMATAQLRTITGERDYDRMIALVGGLLDETRGKPEREDPRHAANTMIAFLTPAIEAYEEKHHPVPPPKPSQYLRLLMQERGLKQSELPEIGNQSVVSQVLSGKRKLNAQQISRIVRRFKVPAEVLLG